jgi:hypothetical protein
MHVSSRSRLIFSSIKVNLAQTLAAFRVSTVRDHSDFERWARV